MNIYDEIIAGPFGSERQFKAAVMRFWRESGLTDDVLEIENEEKAPGMPDALAFYGGECALFEFKLSDENSVIEFQSTQPLFYKQHRMLHIRIIAWDAPRSRIAVITPAAVIAAKSLRYKIPEVDEA